MNICKTILKGLLSARAITALSVGAASAGGTDAGTSVENTFSLTYDVGGTPQPPIDTTGTPTVFTVDRLVNLTVASTGNTTVAPGAQDEELVYSLLNSGNDTQGYILTVANVTESGAADDHFDASGFNITYYVDVGTPGAFDATDLAGTAYSYTPGSGNATIDVPKDGIIWIVVDGDIPTVAGDPSLTDTDTAEITLYADTVVAGNVGNPGVQVNGDGDGNSVTGVAENVLADIAGTADVANAGDHSADGTYIIASADLTAAKAVGVYSEDGSGCTTAVNFGSLPALPNAGYAVPGACVEYRITVQNTGTSASADATDLVITDILPDDLTFQLAARNGFTNGLFNTPTSGQNCIGGACTVSLTSPVGNEAGLANSTTGIIVIRALVK